MIRSAERSGNMRNSSHSYVHTIAIDARPGRATGAVFRRKEKCWHLQRAKAVILSATERKPASGAAFRFRKFPDGLAKLSG